MATLREIAAKRARGEELTAAEQQTLAEAQQRVSSGASTPDAPAQTAGLGDAVIGALRFMSSPGGMEGLQGIGGLTAQATRQVPELAQSPMVTGEGRIPDDMQDVGEFRFPSENLPEPFGTLARIAPSGGLPQIGRLITGALTGDEDPMREMQARLGFMADRRPEARMDILQQSFGDDVEFGGDELGNVLVDLQGQGPAFLNRPGASPQDFQDIAIDAVKFSPVARASNWVGQTAQRLPTLPGRIGRSAAATGVAGAGSAATEAGTQALGELFGSEQPINTSDVYMAGALGAAGETLAAPFRTFRPEARQIMDRAEGMNVPLTGSPRRQVMSTRDAARRMGPEGPERPFGRTAPRGEGVREIPSRLREERTRAMREADQLFDDPTTGARATARGTKIDQRAVSQFNNRVRNVLDEGQYDIPERGATRKLFDQLEELADMPEGTRASVKLNALQTWRKRATQRAHRAGGSPYTREEAQALRATLDEYDDWIMSQHTRDMVSGDQEAIDAWRRANQGWADFRRTYDGNAVIRKLHQEENLTPETVRKYILGGAKLPNNTQAADVVRQLDNILGADSAAAKGIRAEVAADITAPLFGKGVNPPDIRAFLENYDTFMSQNNSLANTLWPDNLSDAHELARLARGIARRSGSRIPSESDPAVERMHRLATSWIVGHNIAQGGARMDVARGVVGQLREAAGGRAARMNILREHLGYEPTQRIFPHGTGPVVAGQAVGEIQSRRQPDMQQRERAPDLRAIVTKLGNNEPLTPAEQDMLDRARQRRQQNQQPEGVQ